MNHPKENPGKSIHDHNFAKFGSLQSIAQLLVILIFHISPLLVGWAVLTAYSASLTYIERKFGVLNWFNLGIMAFSLFAAPACFIWNISGMIPTILLFGILTVAFSVHFLASGRPPAAAFSKGIGNSTILWCVSILLLCVYVLGILFSIVQIEYPENSALVPTVLILGIFGICITLFSLKVGHIHIGSCSTVGEYECCRLTPTKENIEFFFRFFMTVIKKSSPSNSKITVEEMTRRFIAASKEFLFNIDYFSLAKDGQTIGIVSFLEYSKEREIHDFGMELDWDHLRRKYGKIHKIGYLGISPKFRNKPNVFRFLLRAAVDSAFENDCYLLVSFALPNVLPVYRKIGFTPISNDFITELITGNKMMPMMLNLAELTLCKSEDLTDIGMGPSNDAIDSNLGERYVRRTLLRNFWRKTPIWKFNVQEYFKIGTE